MAERDRIPPPVGPSGDGPVEPERDPTALAAWRRVAEQRRRRVAGEAQAPVDGPREEPDPVDDGDGTDAPVLALSRHDLLLALAGRIDDDALSAVRELVAVEDDAAAADLLGGCLLAGGVGVSEAERAALAAWFRSARVDTELAGALGTDTSAARRASHRFVRDLPESATGDGETVARAAARLSGVARVSQCWRVTPAGHVPGPLPHRVVLVETDSAQDCEHVAHHVAHAARSLGAVSVEVFATGSELPTYQRDALATATALGGRAGPDADAEPADDRVAEGSAPERSAAEGSAAERPPSAAARAVLPSRRRPGAGAALFAPPGGGQDDGSVGAGDPETAAWRVVADADRGAPAASGWSVLPPSGPDERGHDDADGDGYDDRYDPSAHDDEPDLVDVEDEPADVPEPDLDPDAAAERIAALWREPSPVDAFDAPLPTDGLSRNLLEPDRPAPDLDAELARYDARRPGPAAYTGSFGRVDDPEAWRSDAVTGDLDRAAPRSPAPPDTEARIRRARRHGWDHDGDDDAPAPSDGPSDDRPSGAHDARFGAAHRPGLPGGPGFGSPVEVPHGAETTAPVPPVVPGPPGPSGADPARPSGWSAETEEAVNSQLSDRERDLLARLHAELASRERLESGEPDPWTTEREGRNGHAHGAAPHAPAPHAPAPNGPSPSPRPRPTPGPPPVNGHRPRNGHGLPTDRDGDVG